MFGDGAAKLQVVAGKAEGGEIRGDEIAAIGGQGEEAQALQAGVQNVAALHQLVRQGGEIGVRLGEAEGDGALQIGGGGEGEVLVRLGDEVDEPWRAGDVADLPAGEGEGFAGAADA